MGIFSGPAAKMADKNLFYHSPPSVQKLQRKSRGELRVVARAAFWRQKQAADAAAAATDSGAFTGNTVPGSASSAVDASTGTTAGDRVDTAV